MSQASKRRKSDVAARKAKASPAKLSPLGAMMQAELSTYAARAKASADFLRRSEIRLIEQAVKGRWPIPETERPAIVTQLIAVVIGSDSDRARIAAARALAAMDAMNMSQERLDGGESAIEIVVRRVTKDLDGRPVRAPSSPAEGSE